MKSPSRYCSLANRWILTLGVLACQGAVHAAPRGRVAAPAVAAASLSASSPRRVSLDVGWRFHLGEIAVAERFEFDDADWSPVRLPHDWAIAGPFDPNLNPHTAALPVSGVGWYRRSLQLAVAPGKDYYAVEFDGAMANSQVWLNGHRLGERPYGFIGCSFDLTPFLRPAGRSNVLAVRLAPEADASRWYPGAGIYRHVWLTHTAALSVAQWGTSITTSRITAASADVAVQTRVLNRGPAALGVSSRLTLVDPAGRALVRAEQPVAIKSGGQILVHTTLRLPRPWLWDPERPNLYSLVSEVRRGGKTLDRFVSPFGVRTVVFDAARGLYVNGRHLKLHGVCLHHDLGALGATVSRRATERQLHCARRRSQLPARKPALSLTRIIAIQGELPRPAQIDALGGVR